MAQQCGRTECQFLQPPIICEKGCAGKQRAGFGVDVVDAPVVYDGNVITSTSPATAMEVAFALLSRITSTANAAQVKYVMGFERDVGD